MAAAPGCIARARLRASPKATAAQYTIATDACARIAAPQHASVTGEATYYPHLNSRAVPRWDRRAAITGASSIAGSSWTIATSAAAEAPPLS